MPAFIKATPDRLRKIEGSVAEVDRSIAAAREEISLVFQEFKKYETAHGNHLRREARKQSRRAQMVSDELGIDLHRRQTVGLRRSAQQTSELQSLIRLPHPIFALNQQKHIPI